MPGARYECAVDFGAVAAIDFHTHVEVDSAGHGAYHPDLAEATGRFFKLDPGHAAAVDDLAELYRGHNTAAVVFTIDATTSSGRRPNSVEELIAGAARNNDVLIPFGTVDPWSDGAAQRVTELTDVHGVRGFKFHPSFQGFEPNDRRFYPIYEAISGGRARVVPHRSDRPGFGHAGWVRDQTAVFGPDVARRRRRRLS